MGTLFCADAHKRKRQDPKPGALHPNLRLFTKQKPRCGYLTSDAWLAAEPPFYLHCFPGDVWEGETYTGDDSLPRFTKSTDIFGHNQKAPFLRNVRAQPAWDEGKVAAGGCVPGVPGSADTAPTTPRPRRRPQARSRGPAGAGTTERGQRPPSPRRAPRESPLRPPGVPPEPPASPRRALRESPADPRTPLDHSPSVARPRAAP